MSDGEWHQNRGIRSELETQEAAERRGAGWWFLSSGQAEDQIPGGQFQGGGVGQRGGRFGGGVQSAGGRSSVQFSCSVVSDSLWSHVLQQARLPCLSSTLRVYSNSCPSSWWCHPTISSSVVPFSSCPQSLPAPVFSNESTLHMRWPKYWSFSFSIIPKNTQGCFRKGRGTRDQIANIC